MFLISGLWHGANWTFIIWGAVHGLFLIAAVIKNKILERLAINVFNTNYFKIAEILITFSLVSLAWVLFRASSISDAIAIYKKMLDLSFRNRPNLYLNQYELIFSFLTIGFLLFKEKFWFAIDVTSDFRFYVINFVILFSCYFFGVFNQKQFIYFQF